MLTIVERKNDGPADDEHGDARRLPAAQVPAIESVRLSPPGAEVTLINISQRGLLAECRTSLRPGMRITVTFSGSFTPAAVRGRVARTAVAAMAQDGLRYHIGIAFDAPIPPLAAPPAAEAAAAAVAARVDPRPTGRGIPRGPVNRW